MWDASTRVLDVKKRSSGAAIGMVPNFMVQGGFGYERGFTFFVRNGRFGGGLGLLFI